MRADDDADLPLFLVSYLKADVSILGVCQVFAVLLEIPMFCKPRSLIVVDNTTYISVVMSTRIIAALGVRKTIFLSQLIIIARLGSYIFLSLGVYWALVGELLQGLCFGLFWSAAVKSISDKAPEEYQVPALFCNDALVGRLIHKLARRQHRVSWALFTMGQDRSLATFSVASSWTMVVPTCFGPC